MAKDWSGDTPKKKKKDDEKKVTQKVVKPSSVSKPAKNNTPQRQTDTGTGGQKQKTTTVSQRTKDAQNQKSYGTTRPQVTTKKTVTSTNPRSTSQRTQQAQMQKTYGTTKPELKTSAQARQEREEKRKERQQKREQLQLRKSGLLPEQQPTAEQKKATDRAIKNTPELIKKAGLDVGSGYLQTINDLTARTAEKSAPAKAAKMGIEPGTEAYKKVEEERKETAERARQSNESLYQKMQQRQAEWDEKTKDAKGLEKAYYGAVESGTGMLADTAIGLLTGTGQVGALASMGMRTYGSSANQARAEGATEAEAGWYGLGQAAKEMGTEMIGGGGIAKLAYGKGALGLGDIAANTLIRNLKGQSADLAHMGVRLLGDVAEENIEELAGWGLDPLIKEFTYGRNVRERNIKAAQSNMRQQSDALRSEIKNEDDARAAAAYLASDDFIDQTVSAYEEAGLSKKDAKEVAERMRDYLTASLTGDTESMEKIEDEVSRKVSGPSKITWDFQELKDTVAATTLLVGATGLPANMTTAAKGDMIKSQLGDEGVRALANTAIEFEDSNMSLKAKAMKSRLDEGKELTSSQVYDLQAGMQEQVRKDTEREQSSRRMAARAIQNDNLLTPYRENQNGGIDLDEVTEQAYRDSANKAGAIIDALSKESKESITDLEVAKGSKAIAGFQTGVFTVDDANALNYSNTTVRAAFEEATGINLGQYIVRDKNGEVNIPATNTATKDALFAMAADNLVKSAQAETANWMDNAKGQVVTQVSARMGANGTAVLQQALDGVDERDRSKYMMTANATDMLYQAARNMGTEWSTIAPEATKMFPGISESKLKMMYEAGLQDRELANDKARGRQVRMGEALSEMGEQETATGNVYIDTEVPLKGSVIRTFTEIAKNLHADIHFVDYIYDSNNDPINGANGSYDPNTNTFYLNVATGAETNIGYIFMHETTHYLKTFAPEQYQALEDLVRERWFAFNPSQMQDAIARKIEAYKRVTNGQQVLTEEQALEEIIADASHDFINDPEFAKQVAEEDMGLAKALLDSIRNALRMLRRIFASGSIDDETHMNSLFRELDILTEAEALWLNAYKVAVQNSAITAMDNWQNVVNEKSQTRLSMSEDIEKSASIDTKTREALSEKGVDVTEGGSAIKYSLASWNDTDKEALVSRLVKAGYEEIVARKWVSDVNTVAATIFADMGRLNYEADQFQDALKPNSEYYFTLDLSTLCQKRRLYQGTYNAIMHKLINKALHPEDTVRLRQMMAEMGYETPCGICYEESRKKNEGKFAEKWIDKYKAEKHDDPYVPTLADVTTTDGRAMLREEHPEVLESYLNYQKGRGSANPKVSFTHTDYRGDILRMTPKQIENVKHIGGLRIQSFSDFETVHVIDMMQAIMDMASMNLTAQAYTKVPAFADIFGGTGIKINLSLIGQLKDGKLWFDAKEGIDPDEAFRIREKYSANVGTILVGANTESILAAWADPRIDMVIPFHRSGWAKAEFEKLGLGEYEDFQEFQSERYLDGSSPKGISLADAKMEGIYPEDYWDYNKTGKENAEAYLKLCAEKKYRPVFYNFLEDNGDGTWSLKADGSTDGYWKSLVDYKMYNNEGVGSPQVEVQPIFDMDVAADVMAKYEGNADTLPVAQDVVDKFVDEISGDTRYSISTEALNSKGKVLTDGQIEYFKDSKARDAEGRLVPVFHTTDYGGFTIFDPSYSDDKRSLFFASNWNVSQTYGRYGYEPIDLQEPEFKTYSEEELMGMLNKSGDFRALTPKEFYDSNQGRKYAPGSESYNGYFYNEERANRFEKEYPNGNYGGGLRFYSYLDERRKGNVKDDQYVLVYFDKPYHPYAYGGSVEELLSVIARKKYDEMVKKRTERQSGYYSCYLNLVNPLIVDAKGANWNAISYNENAREFETYNDFLEDLKGKYDEAVRGIQVIQEDYNYDYGLPSRITIKVEKAWKDEDGHWQYGRELNDEVSITLDDYDFDPSDASMALWTAAEEAMYKMGLPHSYVDYLETEFVDYDGDINYTPEDYDFIDAKTDKYTIASERVYEDLFGYEEEYSTRDLAELAESKGHDGVIIRNLYDIGGRSAFQGKSRKSDIFIAFSSNQVKDIGNENPTENPDIRYSIVDDDEAMSHAAHDYAYDTSYEALSYYESLIDTDSSTETTYERAKKYIAKDVDEFYAGLTRYADGMKFDDPVLEEGRVRMARSKQDYFNSNVAKWNDTWLTEGEVLDPKSVKKPVRDLVMATMQESDTNKKYKTELVNKTIIDMRLAYFYAKQGRTDVADALLWHSAHRMIDGVEFYADDSTYEEYKGLRDYLKTTRVQLGEEYWSDVDFGAFRKANFGRINLVKGSTNVDQIYMELEELFPGLFNSEEYTTPPDQLMHISEVLDSIQPYKEAYSSEQVAELATDIASDLVDIMQNGKELQSTADRYKNRYEAKVKAMKARHAEAMLKVRQQKDKGIKAERAKFKEYVEKQREKKYHAKYFQSIQTNYKKLTERLLSNTADKNIPEQYKKELAKVLAAFDLQTVGSKKWEARTGRKGQNSIKMATLKVTLNNIENKSGEFHVSDAITDIIDELLGKNVGNGSNRSIEGLTIDELNSSELARIDKLLKALVHEFNTYKTVKINAKRQQVQDIGRAQVESALEHAKVFGAGQDYYGIKGWVDRILNMDELTPAYLFRRIDPNKEGMALMYEQLEDSHDRYIRNTVQLSEWIDEIVGEYHHKGLLKKDAGVLEEWRSENYAEHFKLENGHTITLTPAQMMSVYCLSKRAQAYNHMTGAGVVIAPVSYNAKILSDLKKKAKVALPEVLTDADIKNITTKLSDDQVKVADKLQNLMADKMAAWGNEASMNVLGIELFGEPDYFPIKSDKAGLISDLSEDQFVEAIRSFGFTKAVQPGARNAIMVEDIFDVIAQHCNNMNLYNAYSEAINDFMKVYNYRNVSEEGEYTVKQAIGHAYSQKATNFIMSFMKDLNGNVSNGRSTGINDAFNDSLAKAKKASVFANIRVAAQQPTAIGRAFAVISPKYASAMLKPDKAVLDEMFEHCPIAKWKSLGYYDINMGRNIEDVIMNNNNVIEEAATWAYGALDNITWGGIWQMVKAETEDTHPNVEKGSDEYWDLCNRRMREVVAFTQVVDSPFHRSHAMRSKNFMDKLATAFGAEPTLTYNMVRDGYIRAKEMVLTGDKAGATKVFGRTMSVFVFTAGLTAAAAAFADVLRGKHPDGDDDDELTLLQLWWANTLANWKDNVNLLNNIYYVKDIMSLLDGWQINNLAFQGWKYIGTGVQQLYGSPYARSKDPWWKNFAYGVGYLSGVPVKTVMTDFGAIFNKAKSLFGFDTPILDSYIEMLDNISFKQDEKKSDASMWSLIKEHTMDKAAEKMGYKPAEKKTEESKREDGFLARVGLGKTEEEKAQEAYEKKVQDIADKTADLEGEARDKKVWSYVTTYLKSQNGDKPLNEFIQEGDYNTVSEYRKMYVAAGGDTEYFDQRIFDTSKSAMKKSIIYDPTDEQITAQDNIKSYLLTHGMNEAELSEMAYKSDTAKDMKVAFRLNDKELMLETLEPLVRAGLSYEDLERLWENRNRMQLSSYKGRYKDKLKSTGTFIWPTDGQITSYFGYRKAPTAGASSNHPAIDIGAPMGSEVVAADGGVVIYVGQNGGYGKSVGIKHDNGMVTYYNHLSAWNVNVGDTVAQGQPIANVGSTGVSTGPHLDFKILDANGEPVDPLKYLSSRS